MYRESQVDKVDTIFAGVLEVLTGTIDVPVDKVRMTSLVRDDLGADSLDSVEIVMGLEDKFQVTLSEESANRIKTVGDLVQVISEALACVE